MPRWTASRGADGSSVRSRSMVSAMLMSFMQRGAWIESIASNAARFWSRAMHPTKSYRPACERLHLEYNRYKVYCKRRNREPASFEVWKVERNKKYCADCGKLLPSDYACNKKYCAACKKLRERYTSYKMTCKRTARQPVSFEDWKAGAR